MAEKTLNTRILLKYDTYANWTTNNPVLRAGEVAIATIATGNTQEVNSVTAPQVLIKVGDDTSAYNALPFVSAKAADVYGWAKAEKKPTYTASEIGGLSDFIAGEIEDTDTQYQIVKVDDYNYKLQSKTLGGSWADVSNGAIVIPKYDDTEVKADIEALEGLVGTTAVATQIANAISALNLANTYAPLSHTHTGDDISVESILVSATNLQDYITEIDKLVDNVDIKVEDIKNGTSINDFHNVEIELNKKVDVVSGKGLSTNDLTNALKSNYDAAYTHSQADHAPANAQANVIESVKVNGTAQTVTSKAVDITVPTKVSQLTNDSGYLTTHQDISGKADKATTLAGYGITNAYTKTEVDTKVDGVQDDVDALSGELTTYKTTVSSTYETKSDASAKLTEAKGYTDTKISELLDGASDETLNSINELANAIKDNDSAIDALNTVAGSKASQADLTALTTRVTTAEGDISALETEVAKKANNADLAAIAKTGNVNDLVQTTGDVLIFDCGNSDF